MTALTAIPLATECSNVDCPNAPGEGAFVLMETGEPVVGGHRDLRLWLCAPCASALQRLSQASALREEMEELAVYLDRLGSSGTVWTPSGDVERHKLSGMQALYDSAQRIRNLLEGKNWK